MDPDFLFCFCPLKLDTSKETTTGIATLILYIISDLISISNLKNQHCVFSLNRMEGCYLRFERVFRINARGVNFVFLSAAFAPELAKREM